MLTTERECLKAACHRNCRDRDPLTYAATTVRLMGRKEKWNEHPIVIYTVFLRRGSEHMVGSQYGGLVQLNFERKRDVYHHFLTVSLNYRLHH